MLSWTFYPAFLGTVISVSGLSRIALLHDNDHPHTLSELAAAEQHLLRQFRTILWTCGLLFAITMYWFIGPRVPHPFWIEAAWTVELGGNWLAALIPARNKTLVVHNVLAQTMAVGMLALAYGFWWDLSGRAEVIELMLAVSITVFTLLTFLDKRRFIVYEMLLIFFSHFSILVAAIALR